MTGGIGHEFGEFDSVLYPIWGRRHFCGRAFGIYEPSGFSGGRDHAAGGSLGSPRKDRFSDCPPDHDCGGNDRQLAPLSAGL